MIKKDTTVQTTKLGNPIASSKNKKNTKNNRSKTGTSTEEKAFSRMETVRFFSGLLLLVVSLIALLAYT